METGREVAISYTISEDVADPSAGPPPMMREVATIET
jgi:hypothetical protein